MRCPPVPPPASRTFIALETRNSERVTRKRRGDSVRRCERGASTPARFVPRSELRVPRSSFHVPRSAFCVHPTPAVRRRPPPTLLSTSVATCPTGQLERPQ